jgi:diguanylate cyclase (GGDEF)-like protein/PAS domain S-box-containing protein
MNRANKNVLFITPNNNDASLVQELLAETQDDQLILQRVSALSEGIELVSNTTIDVVLLHLSHTDSHGIEAFNKLFLAAPHIPTLIFGGSGDENMAQQALQIGAVDYLLRDHVNGFRLSQALRNAIKRRSVENALFMERDRAQVTLNSIGDAVLSTDIEGNITYLNLVAEKMTGWSREEASGKPLTEVFQIINGTTRTVAQNPMELAIKENKAVGLAADCLLIRRDGTERAIEDTAAPIHDSKGQVAGAVIVFHDVSESRDMKIRMSHLAQHDALTDLPNRTLLSYRITQAIALASRHNKQFAALFLDIDRFKLVNDSLGHTIGDQLLQSVAARLSACVRSTDTVSRLGGDEFVVVLSEIEHVRDATIIADKIIASIAAPHVIAQHAIHVTVSLGISLYPEDGIDAEALIKNADIALYHAKNNGRNNAQFFTQEMNLRAIEQRAIEMGLHNALKRGEFVLQYQPKVNLVTGVITGAEALLRWHHPVRGIILPDTFLPIAEESRLIIPIGQWVLREACRQGQAWRDSGFALRQIAVNISAVEFQSNGFLDTVKSTLKETGFDPHCLELELTESLLMQNAESTSSLLNELKTMGVQLAIDDFGTGYSSLSYLSRFPIDTLKIDQTFVHKMVDEKSDAAIVSMVINMGKSLKHKVIAEGVETFEQLTLLQGRECEEGQGYYFSEPLGPAEFASILRNGTERIEAELLT